MDSSGLNLLVLLRRRLHAEGGRLAVTGLQPQPARLLQITAATNSSPTMPRPRRGPDRLTGPKQQVIRHRSLLQKALRRRGGEGRQGAAGPNPARSEWPAWHRPHHPDRLQRGSGGCRQGLRLGRWPARCATDGRL
ncbi:STAS domain-containing protein [Streptomyces sp. NPDC048197]|uniref:STAS domain-containing protein n=1 Tax=Streptomyces sp. NPDC048197 TaxID=3365511 RepID=UPI00371E2EAE